MHGTMLIAAIHHQGSLQLTRGWFEFMFGVLVGVAGTFYIEHRK